MANAGDEGVDAPRHVWESAIAKMAEDIGAAIQHEEAPEVIAEMHRLKEFVMHSYKLRFGDPYPDPDAA